METPQNYCITSNTLAEPSLNPCGTITEPHIWFYLGLVGTHTKLTQNPHNCYKNINKILDWHKNDRLIT